MVVVLFLCPLSNLSAMSGQTYFVAFTDETSHHWTVTTGPPLPYITLLPLGHPSPTLHSYLTGGKVGKVGKAFPTCIQEAPRFTINLETRALVSCLQLHSLELTQECYIRWISEKHENNF